IKKTVKKVVTPEIAPAVPPKTEPTPEATVEPPPPPPPPTFEVQLPQEDKGLFGWGLNTDLGGKLLFGSLVLGVRGDMIFDDPLLLGEKIGLAEDAVEYKIGLGFVLSDKFKSIPLYTEAVVYLKEGSLFGLDPFVGAGLILNLYGTGSVSGGMGGQVNLGFLADFGFESRTQVALGYGTYKIGSNISESGIQLSIAQPIKL
ncbi:MAG: hypothetical protein V3T21_02130, partial [Candidatus Margulisiibacteriota bacterium]